MVGCGDADDDNNKEQYFESHRLGRCHEYLDGQVLVQSSE